MLRSLCRAAGLSILLIHSFSNAGLSAELPEESCERTLARMRRELGLPFKAIAQVLPQARFLDGRAEFLRERKKRLPRLVDPRHAPMILDHGHATDTVVVIMHGLYDSPHAQRNLARALHAKGMNVIAPLLPKHWEKDSALLDKVRYQEFMAEQEKAIAIAKKLGKKVVIYGHSAGGLLAVDAALKDPAVAGLVLAAPALELTTPFSLMTTIGSAFCANANLFTGEKPDAYFTPYYSSHAGDEIRRMSEALRDKWGWNPLYNIDRGSAQAVKNNMYRNIKVPVMMMASEGDSVADNDDMALLMANARGPKKSIRSEVLDHSEIGVLPERAIQGRGGSRKDRAYREVWQGISDFFDENFSEAKKPRRAAIK